MSEFVEREIKLRFETTGTARETVEAIGAAKHRPRQLQDDRLLDWTDRRLYRNRCTLRIRDQEGLALLTFKGPPQVGSMKIRKELETTVGDGKLLFLIFDQLGLRVWFRYQKYREEYEYKNVVIAIDETPIGTFIELEGDEQGITETADVMGFTPADYVVESYYGLFTAECRARKLSITDMIFDQVPRLR